MNILITKIVEILTKITPRLMGGVFIFSLSLLILPSRLASIIAVDVLRKNHKDKLGLALLLSFSFLLVEFIVYLKKELIKWRIPKTLIAHLKNLTKEEKEILSEYVNEEKTTVLMDITGGVSGGLEAKNIVYRSSNLSVEGSVFSYNIQPWALEYLKKHKKLLGAKREFGKNRTLRQI